MTESFVVTTPNPMLVLGPQRTGQFVLTLTNVAGRQLRAQVTITPMPPVDPSWITIRAGASAPVPVPATPGAPAPAGGTFQVPMALGQTVQLTLDVQVPMDLAPGVYQIQPVVAAEDHTDTDFKATALAVTVPAPPPPQPKRFPFWIPIAVVVLLLVAGGIIWFFSREPTPTFTVPNVVGQSSTTAQKTLKDAGFTPTVNVTGAPVCFPKVSAQLPTAGTVQEGIAGDVTITVRPALTSAFCFVKIPLPTAIVTP